jgi:hypothetical protein
VTSSRFAGVLLAIAIAGASGCGGDGSPAGAVSGPPGTLIIRLRDNPFLDAQAVVVTFSEIGVRLDGASDFRPLPFVDGAQRSCDLKQLLRGNSDLMVNATLPAGRYTQTRVRIAAATLYFASRAPTPACSPAAPQIHGRQAAAQVADDALIGDDFAIGSGRVTTLTLDFDGERSFSEPSTGQYVLDPIIRASSIAGP